MEEKNFEPITARSLAEQIAKLATGENFYSIEHHIRQATELLEPHIRKPSDETKSVPQRCEEAYDEAVKLLAEGALIIDKEPHKAYTWREEAYKFTTKPNPFKEANIVKGEAEPTLLPFDLGLAAQGHKVVTRDGRSAEIVAEGLKGVTPICAIITDSVGVKVAGLFTLGGKLVDHKDNQEDLFILKDRETVDIHLYRYKANGSIFAKSNNKMISGASHDFIKTITVEV